MRGRPRARLRREEPQEEAALSQFDEAVLDEIAGAAVRAVHADPRARIVIDGRSGAGKTTLAHRIATDTGARVVSLDEFYPGWNGLREATPIAERLVADHAAGREGVYQRWDWDQAEWIPRQHVVDPAVPLIIEGCGALTENSARNATASLWIDGDARSRWQRAMARDGNSFRAFWDTWAAQENAHIGAHDPRRFATFAADVV